ncbi:VWA domain-containing protein [Streptomyces sp. NPDC048639]|uniref:vWA domain-containing protein n=1 Tax=Streptomyces sp. NPDC048639 TaxID=3365581 RepID=UPI00372003E6
MARRHRRTARALVGGALLALAMGPLPAGAAPTGAHSVRESAQARADGQNSLLMVLDSSGSMKEDDGSGSTRIASARKAVGTVVDSLPDGHPTGLRVYGADKPKGCDDTRLARRVAPLDRTGIKQAVADVTPKGDTPIGLSLRKAAADLPEPPNKSLGRRTILLISDGEDNCGAPRPCDVAEQLGGNGVDLRIDTIGFQVRGKARDELECIAEAGHGSYYDAPDADALARQLQRASRLSADGFRFKGKRIEGGSRASEATGIAPGQYVDTIGPGETLWYAADLDATSTADMAVTAVPQPGVKVAYGDGIELKLTSSNEYTSFCGSENARFAQDEGAMTLTTAVSRVPSAEGDEFCDDSGRYLLSVHRSSSSGSDQARWPVELRYGTERPLKKGMVPAQSQTQYGKAGKDAVPPTGTPDNVTGGTGFNDASPLERGVWRDRLLPAQTRFYKIHVGWGQQLRYSADFANEPTLDGSGGASSFVDTAVFAPGRTPVTPGGEFTAQRIYDGEPMSVEHGTVPVSWTNRWESAPAAVPVRSAGDYYVAVSLGPEATKIAKNAAIGVVLRVDVVGDELAGPQHKAPVLHRSGEERGEGAAHGDSAAPAGAGWSGAVIAAVAGGAAVVSIAVLLLVRRRRGPVDPMTRGGA